MRKHLRKLTTLALLSTVLICRADDVIVTTPLTAGPHNWYSTNTYILNGLVHALRDAVLTIEAGTVIRGSNSGPAAIQKGGLLIARGAKIFAEGTPEKPIIFTAMQDDLSDPGDLGIYERGLWGGVVVMGRTTLNSAVDSAGNAATPRYEVYEGLPDIQVGGEFVHRFGGDDDDDDSGVLRYVSIRHAGAVIDANRELNGLSLGAVGRGTTIEFVEVYAIADDGFEFFGGTVNTRYLVAAFCDDDSFDTDQGFRGKNQFWFGIQAPDRRNYGMELNGELSGTTGAEPRLPLATWEVYNITVIGAGVGTTGAGGDNDAMLLREFLQAKIYNGVFTDFARRGITLGSKGDYGLTNGTLQLCNNLWWGFTGGSDPNTATNLAATAAAEVYFTDTSRSNIIADPMLAGISRDADFGLDPRPLPGSPALEGYRTPPDDGFYCPVDYKGAFGPNDLWITKWTALYQYGLVAPNGGIDENNTVVVSTPLAAGTHNWYRTNTYILNGLVHALSGAVLNIEAGTVIRGSNSGPAAIQKGGLLIARGAQIFAEGTPQNPIIFTALQDDLLDPSDLGIYERGLWGGVVVMGRTTINSAVDSAGNAATPRYEVYEGLPDIQVGGEFVHRFGGNDDDDNSGVMRYVSIRHAGAVIDANRELNGLSLGAVGRGTTIEFVEVYAIADDGFEFFGGTVNTKCLVSAFCDDDSFDTDQGFRGKNQFWFGIQAPDRRNYGMELNGELSGTTGAEPRLPLATWEVYNITVIGAGAGTTGAGGDNDAMLLREFLQAKIYNGVFTDFARRGITLGSKGDYGVTNGTLQLCNNLWWGFTGGTDPNNSTNVAATAAAEIYFTDTSRSNVIADPMLRGISRDVGFGLDPRPAAGSPAWSGARAIPNDGFYTPVSYQGAFGEANWATDWTALGAYCILSARGARNPKKDAGGASGCTPPGILVIVRSGGNVDISFASSVGCTYRLLATSDVAASLASWTEVGSVTATGSLSTLSAATSETQQFFVVVTP